MTTQNSPHELNELENELEPAIILKLVTCQRITSKILDLDGSIPEPAILSGDIGQRTPCFDSCQLIIIWICCFYLDS